MEYLCLYDRITLTGFKYVYVCWRDCVVRFEVRRLWILRRKPSFVMWCHVVSRWVTVFRSNVQPPSSVDPEDRDSTFRRNIGLHGVTSRKTAILNYVKFHIWAPSDVCCLKELMTWTMKCVHMKENVGWKTKYWDEKERDFWKFHTFVLKYNFDHKGEISL
jgi:hypothetical protein